MPRRIASTACIALIESLNESGTGTYFTGLGSGGLASKHGSRVVHGKDAHGVPGRFAGARGVRGEHQARRIQERGVDPRLAFVDIECGAADLAVVPAASTCSSWACSA
jgi:hypothetical protein